jgi:hypothetical protein
MPLAFVQNRGQTDGRVRHYALGNHYAFFATRDELMLSLTKDKPARSLALGLRFIGRNPHAAIVGAKSAPARSTTSPGPTPQAGARTSAATRRSSTTGCGRSSTCGCTSGPAS